MKTPPCPMCEGYGEPLGSLGRTQHYRCRHCGWLFSRTAKPRSSKKSGR